MSQKAIHITLNSRQYCPTFSSKALLQQYLTKISKIYELVFEQTSVSVNISLCTSFTENKIVISLRETKNVKFTAPKFGEF